ncbi:MAG: FGGY family carbohydrate kinase [Eubacteriales bacterium]|nr:FGGY family carbohydrate kinase [Eubacteriales bacterium]
MEKDLILTCDAGTTGCKCTIFNTQGYTLSSVRRSYDTIYPRPNWSEQNMDAILEGVYSGIRELLEQVDPHRIACVGLSGSMNGCIPVDAEGKALHANIIHSDCRAEAQVEEIARRISPEDFYQLTGNRLDTHFTLPKILWIKENLPDVYRRTRWWLNTKDYIYGRLTGRFGYTDYSDASLTIALDIRRRTWSEELIRDTGLDIQRMPVIRPGHDVRGKITRETYRLTGLMPGTPVAIGGGDGPCCARGAGVFDAGNAYTNIGSSAWVSQLLKEPVMDSKARIFNFLDMDGQSCHICGTVQCGAAAFNWAMENLFNRGENSGMDISRFENMARQIQPGSEGVMFLPTLMGWRTPYWDANTRGCLMGFTLYHDKRHIARAVYEGVAYALNTCAEIIVECGAPMNSMMLTGGGARSGLWPDMLAAIYGVPTRVHQSPGEATSLGAAMVAGVGVGIFESYEKAASLARARSTHPVNAQWNAAYRKYYPLYAQIYERLRPINDAIAGVRIGEKP